MNSDIGEAFELEEPIHRSSTFPQRGTVSTGGIIPSMRLRKRRLSLPATPSMRADSPVTVSRERLLHEDLAETELPVSGPIPGPERMRDDAYGSHRQEVGNLRNSLGSRLYNNGFTMSLALFTFGTVSFTIFFAYNSSLEIPKSQALIFSQPQNTILVVNVFSQASMMLLAQLTDGLFDNVRWAFASSKRGVPALSFFALATATTYLGVFMVLYDGVKMHYLELINNPWPWRLDGQVFWGSQRYPSLDVDNCRLLFVLVRAALAFILLVNINFTTTYPHVYESGILYAGLSPLNTSIAEGGQNLDVTSEFWWSFPSLMTDQAAVAAVPPLTCSDSDPSCVSYFLPGTITQLVYNSSLPPILKTNFTDATALIVTDAPGYQIDYTEIPGNETTLLDSDCQVYGMPFAALLICLKNTEDGLIGGIPDSLK